MTQFTVVTKRHVYRVAAPSLTALNNALREAGWPPPVAVHEDRDPKPARRERTNVRGWDGQGGRRA